MEQIIRIEGKNHCWNEKREFSLLSYLESERRMSNEPLVDYYTKFLPFYPSYLWFSATVNFFFFLAKSLNKPNEDNIQINLEVVLFSEFKVVFKVSYHVCNPVCACTVQCKWWINYILNYFSVECCLDVWKQAAPISFYWLDKAFLCTKQFRTSAALAILVLADIKLLEYRVSQQK